MAPAIGCSAAIADRIPTSRLKRYPQTLGRFFKPV
jgi:hypothetical protein